jgi:hypothetical protein
VPLKLRRPKPHTRGTSTWFSGPDKTFVIQGYCSKEAIGRGEPGSGRS